MMWYHAIAYHGTNSRYWWNRSREDLADDVVIPFLSKQVRTATRKGINSLFNFGAVQYITIVKTKAKLKRPAPGKSPSELADAHFLKQHEATGELLEELKKAKFPLRDRSLIEQTLTPAQNKIFVVMKFGDEELDSAYEGVYKPVGLEAGFDEVSRVDELQDSGIISQQMLQLISDSRVIIADLSGERPNCYYEAGFAHALGKEIIFCIQEKYKIHFDLAGHRFIVWNTEASLRRQLKPRLASLREKGNA